MAEINDSERQFGMRLKEIADGLGVPLARFSNEKAPPSLIELLNLIRAYAAITDPDVRRWVVNVAIIEAARSGSTHSPKPE